LNCDATLRVVTLWVMIELINRMVSPVIRTDEVLPVEVVVIPALSRNQAHD
jgi:hypothetical protein